MPNKKCAICAKEIKGVSFDGAPLVDSEVCIDCYCTEVTLAKLDEELWKTRTPDFEYEITIKGTMKIYISNSLQGWMVRTEAYDN